MAQINLKVECRYYGMPLARFVVAMIRVIGFSERTAVRAGLCCTLVRIKIGNRKSWQWMGFV